MNFCLVTLESTTRNITDEQFLTFFTACRHARNAMASFAKECEKNAINIYHLRPSHAEVRTCTGKTIDMVTFEPSEECWSGKRSK